jgi:SnoaL-like domain
MADDAVRVLADRDEIHDIMMRYSHGVDQREMEIVRACFAPDLKTVGWGPGDGFDRDALIRFISGVGHFRETMHMMGNQLIEVSGDTASMDTFAQLTHRLDGDPEKLLVSSRYVEKLTRRDGEWVITQRGGEPAWAPNGVTGLGSDDPAVRWLLDRAEIRDAVVRDTVASDTSVVGTAATGRARNFLGTRLVTIDGDDAWAESYVLVTPIPDGEDRARPADVITPVRWSDHLVRENGRWRLESREIDGEGQFGALPVPPPTDDARVRVLLDRAMVIDAVTALSYAIDHRDEALLRACVAPDVTVGEAEIGVVSGVDALVDTLRATMWAMDATWLFMNNHLVEIAGDDATVQSYVFIIERVAGATEPLSWTEGARRFIDRLHRDGRGWRVVERSVETNMMPDDKVIKRPEGEQGIEALTRRAEARARRQDED